MKLRALMPLGVAVALLLRPSPVVAQAEDFAGDWSNVDAHTRGVVSLHIWVSDDKITVEGKGACHPVNCTIPPTQATLYTAPAPTGESDVLAILVPGVPNSLGKSISRIEILRLVDGPHKLLEMEVLTRYDDGSGRGPWHVTFYFKKANAK